MGTLNKVYWTGFLTFVTFTITLISMALFLVTTANSEVGVSQSSSSEGIISPQFDRTVSIEREQDYMFEKENPKVWL